MKENVNRIILLLALTDVQKYIARLFTSHTSFGNKKSTENELKLTGRLQDFIIPHNCEKEKKEKIYNYRL